MKKTVLVGTRVDTRSKVEGQWIINQLQAYADDYRYQIVGVETKVDVHEREEGGGGGNYGNELERALQNEEIDIVIHNMVNVPYELPEEVVVAAISGRSDPSDALISRDNLTLSELPKGAKVDTGNMRRKCQLLKFRPDFDIVPYRGGVNTRLGRIRNGEIDAFVTAAASLERLGMEDKITEYLPYSVCMPAPGQGAVAALARARDSKMIQLLRKIHNPMVASAVHAERTLLRYLTDKSNVPIGVLVRFKQKRLHLEAVVLSLDGQEFVRAYGTGYYSFPGELGTQVAKDIVAKASSKILDNSWYVRR
ncbi:MAG: hydroxymethylbilane synthase [Clostridia bacterium]|nr:hydroxymethylbilane synthase [Clostridia bacterium]